MPLQEARGGSHFLESYPSGRPWVESLTSDDAVTPERLFIGHGPSAFEVAYATASNKVSADTMRRLWIHRRDGRATPVLLVVSYPSSDGPLAALCGPLGDQPPVQMGIPIAEAERLAAISLDLPNRHQAIHFLTSHLSALDQQDLPPGVRNQRMFATHELHTWATRRPDWKEVCHEGAKLLSLRSRALIEGLGFSVEEAGRAAILRTKTTKRAVAVFLQEDEAFELSADRFDGVSPLSYALAAADDESLPWVLLTRGSQLRVHAARRDVGVGRGGREETFVELDLSLLSLSEAAAGYLVLLAGASSLADGGRIEELLENSRRYAADLGSRLRTRVYDDVVPILASVISSHHSGGADERTLALLYEEALLVLFRLLFVAYAEDMDLLPYRTNEQYQRASLKGIAQDLADLNRRNIPFDPVAHTLWNRVTDLWQAIHKGRLAWGVPAYDGDLLSDDEAVNPAGAALAALSLTDREIGPVLAALLVDTSQEGTGPVDFRSLSVREFGTIYEGLLESSLAVAPTDLTQNREGDLAPSKPGDPVTCVKGTVYLHHRSGSRKATGSYFTKPFAVEHLLDHALEPVLTEHLQRVVALIPSQGTKAAAAALFDFRCVDLAMGSGHFLVAALDRIEAAVASFLSSHPIPEVTEELDRLEKSARDHLGDLAPGVEIERSALLRRLIARRCVYGVDLNPMAVQLARLALWIHTFVPGLPLGFLDHGLIQGDSLTGVATIEEAVTALDPHAGKAQMGILEGQVRAVLARSEASLRTLGQLLDDTPETIEAARKAQREALKTAQPASQLMDLAVAIRLGVARTSFGLGDETAIAAHPDLGHAQAHAKELASVHFPIAFPEVFLRERPGFDCILGNPPWEKPKVEEHAFWARHFPGHRSLPVGDQNTRARRYRRERPDLAHQLQEEIGRAGRLRQILAAGPHPLGEGDADLYKAFAWRFWDLVRPGGAVGVVLPRSALSAKGSKSWRETVLDEGAFTDVTTLLNTGGWVFDDAEHRYTIGLVALRKGAGLRREVAFRGPYASLASYRDGMGVAPVRASAAEFQSWTGIAAFPKIPSDAEGVFRRLLAHPRFDSPEHPWQFRPVTELHATQDKPHMILSPTSTDGLWPVYKGASFDLWTPDTGDYYAWADPAHVTDFLQEKRRRQHGDPRSAFHALGEAWASDPATLPCRAARICFRDTTNATNTRTVISCLVPPCVVLQHTAPYLLRTRGDARDEAYLLGVLSSRVLDWYARCIVETHVSFFILGAFPIPAPSREDAWRREVEGIAARLAASDERLASWAREAGVRVGSVSEADRPDLLARLDAAVALLYGLRPGDVSIIMETFHPTWRHQGHLERVLRQLAHLREGRGRA